ncbi:MAG TPA: hypothetical protein VMT18_09805 [Planctomycetota bacterium]|nr:hypothetical protein [Planctomycetota bacterium]
MTLQRLSCLVLTVVLGTAWTVRWYLDAEEAVQAARSEGSGALVHQHLPLPMRAEPAHFRWVDAASPQSPATPCTGSRPNASQALAPLVRSPSAERDAATMAGPAAFEPGAHGSF